MQTKFGTLKLLSSFWCSGCDTSIDGPAWCVESRAGETTELRHLVEDRLISKQEADEWIAQGAQTGSAPDGQ